MEQGFPHYNPLPSPPTGAKWDVVTIVGKHKRRESSMSNPETCLRAICAEGTQELEKLLSQGVDPNALFDDALLLVEAARDGRKDLVAVLLAHGAHINREDNLKGDIALTVACFEGHEDLVDFLLSHGADVNACCRGVFTPLSEAAGRASKSRVSLVRKLLQAGADPARVFHSQKGVAVSNVLMSACRDAHPDVIEMLIQAGAPVNQSLFFGTALTSAVEKGNAGAVEVLLRHGADVRLAVPNDPKLQSTAGKTPMELARARRNKKIIAMLEKHGK